MKKEFERQTTEKQIAENEGHEQFQKSQRIEPGKVQELTDAANDADFKERNNYIVLVTTLITTVTFAAAFQVPGGYDDKGKSILLKDQQFKYFLICDSLAFGTSTASLFIYFGMPLLQRLTPGARYIILQLAWLLSMVSLLSMLFASPFWLGCPRIPVFYYLLHFHISRVLPYDQNSTVDIVIIISSSIYFKGGS